MICGRDGWDKLTNPPENENSSLMECSQCWEILHPKCLQEKNPDLPMESCINDDLPNSWECPKCCRNGKPDQVKPRQMKGKCAKVSEVARPSISVNDNGMLDVNPSANEIQEKLDLTQMKIEPTSLLTDVKDVKRIFESEPLDLGTQKKKVKAENYPIKEENDRGYMETDEELKQISLNSNLINMNSCIQKQALPLTEHKEEPELSNPISSINKEMAFDQPKKKPLVSHIRSCSKFPVNFKKIFKNEQGKVLQVKNGNDKLVIRSKSRLPPGATIKRHGETARERLFRNLKSLKKSSELRVGALKVKNSALVKSDELIKSNAKDIKLVQSCDIIKMKHDVLHNLADEEKLDRNVITCQKLVKTEKSIDKLPLGQNPKISSMLHNSPNLKKPKYVVRPAPIVEDNTADKLRNSFVGVENLAIEKEVMLPVFQFLSIKDLFNCQLVCKTWNRWSVDPRLWTFMDLTRRKITANVLIGIVRRQPVTLNLSWTNLSRRQLTWLIARLPQMKELIISGCSAASIVGLCTCNCPLLRSLDLSWVEGLTDAVVRDLLAPPPDSRPGFIENKTRLRHLTDVKLAGADISDVSVRLLAHHLPLLSKLDLSHCHKITDMGIAVLGAAKSARLSSLDVSSCSNITDTSLEALKRCSNLIYLDLRDCVQVTEAACSKFVGQNRQTLVQKEAKFIQKCN